MRNCYLMGGEGGVILGMLGFFWIQSAQQVWMLHPGDEEVGLRAPVLKHIGAALFVSAVFCAGFFLVRGG